jgi:hypothetical protein
VADETVLRVRVTARARRDAIGTFTDGVLAVRLAAPPVDGAANKALIALLAGALGVARSAIRIESGEHARHKTLRIGGLAPAEALRRLGAGGA